MEKAEGGKQERVITDFGNIKEATEWTLDMLNTTHKKHFLEIQSKYDKAKKALRQNNWALTRNIIEEEYEYVASTLETRKIHFSKVHPGEEISSSTPIAKRARYHGILLDLIDREIGLTGNYTGREESEEDLNEPSTPELLKELSSLAPDAFHYRK